MVSALPESGAPLLILAFAPRHRPLSPADPHPTSMTTSPAPRIRLYEKLGYGFGEFGNNLFWQFFMYFQLYFYTDVFKIASGENAALAAGKMFMYIKFFDAMFDVFIGVTADRTKTRWGKYRPYLLWGAIPFGVAGLLAFTTPDLAEGPKLAYAYVTYTFLMMMYSLVAIPQNSLLGVMTNDIQERTILSKYKFLFAFSSGLVVQWCTPILVKSLGHGNEALGYKMAVLTYGAIAVVAFVVAFLVIRERVSPPAEQKTDLKQDMKDLLLGNAPWLILGVVTLSSILHIALRSSTFVYYFKYYVQDRDVDTIFWGVRHFTHTELLSSFLVLGTAVTITGTALVPTFTRLLGKRTLYCVLIGGAGLVSIAYYFVPPENVRTIFLLQVLWSITLGPTSAVLWPMYADCADFSEWKHRRRATALIFSAAIMAQKLGWAGAGWVTGFLLSYYGYVADTVLSQRTLGGLLLVNTVYPAICSAIATGTVLVYSLSDKRMKSIEGDLLARRAEAGATPAQ